MPSVEFSPGEPLTANRALRERAEAIPEAAACASQCEPEELAALKAQLDDLRQKLS